MSPLALRLSEGLHRVWEVLPALIFAIAILVFGYFLARRFEGVVDRLLKQLDFNRVAEAGGLREAVDRTGSHLDPVHAVGKLIFWVIMLIVTLLASAALGLESVNQMFTIMISFIPNLIAAIVIVILGMVIGEFLRGLILASAGSVAGVPTLARVSKALVVVIAIFMALQQLGVPEEMITSLLTVILGAGALAVGLAFGLGNTSLAGEITREWYERSRRKATQPERDSARGQAQTATAKATEATRSTADAYGNATAQEAARPDPERWAPHHSATPEQTAAEIRAFPPEPESEPDHSEQPQSSESAADAPHHQTPRP